MSSKNNQLFIVTSFEDVSILRKFAILFLISSIIPMVLLYYVYFKSSQLGIIVMLLMVLGVLVGYFSIRSLLIKTINIAKENRKAIEPFLNAETVRELNSGKNELVVLNRVFSVATKQLESNINELKKKNEELKVLDQLKNDFVNYVSHEFRLPLTIIQESIRQIAEGKFGQVTEAQTKYFNMSLRNIDRLKGLIDNMLDISKIEIGKLEIIKKNMDMVETINEVVSDFSQRIEKKGLGVKTSLPSKAMVIADKNRIIQVLINLIGNALKFTSQGCIEITLKEHGTFIECSILDSGIGIAPENIPHLFSKFHQVGHLDAQQEKGSGLGLAISKNIVELHNGKISIESNVGKGTTFTFTLPKIKEGNGP